MVNKRKLGAVLFLLFFAPFSGEVLSTSTEFFTFFFPLVFFLLVALYGFGALILRELMVRWKKGCLSLLIWGGVYGIVEEALILRSFFNPDWPDLSIVNQYTRALGINFVFASVLVVFHSVFSITIPIVLTHLAFPDVSNEQWLSKRALKLVIIAFFAIPSPLFFIMTSYPPPPLQYFAFLVLAIGMFILGKRIRYDLSSTALLPRSKKTLFLLGAIFTPVFFFSSWLFPIFKVPLFFTCAFLFLWSLLIFWLADPSLGRKYHWSEKQLLSFVSGILLFMIVFMPLIAPNPMSQLLASLLTAIILYTLWHKS